MTLSIAQVAVDNATIHFDKLYSYRVPETLAGRVWPGSMVLVPFGRGISPGWLWCCRWRTWTSKRRLNG